MYVTCVRWACMYVCMYLCMYVGDHLLVEMFPEVDYMYARTSAYEAYPICILMYVYVCVLYVCMYVCMYVCTVWIYMYVRP
jgi:hypothetical protein